MNTLKTTLTLALSLAVLAGCDDDDVTGIENDLVGDFQATAVEFQSQDDPNTTSEVIADGGAFDITFRENGTFESSFQDGNGVTLNQSGNFEVRGDVVEFPDDLFVDDDLVTPTAFTVSGGGGSGDPVEFEGESQFDFDLDQEMDDAAVTVQLRRAI